MKCKKLCSGFELDLPNSFPMMIMPPLLNIVVLRFESSIVLGLESLTQIRLKDNKFSNLVFIFIFIYLFFFSDKKKKWKYVCKIYLGRFCQWLQIRIECSVLFTALIDELNASRIELVQCSPTIPVNCYHHLFFSHFFYVLLICLKFTYS